MTTTTTTVPNASDPRVKAHMDAGATERQAVALVLHDPVDRGGMGLSRKDAAAALGIQVNPFGNLYNGGRRKVGRADEVHATGGDGGSTTKATAPVTVGDGMGDVIERQLAAIHARIEALTSAVVDAEADLTAFVDDPAPWIAAETERRTGIVDAAVNARDDAMPRLEREVARAEAARDAILALGGDDDDAPDA